MLIRKTDGRLWIDAQHIWKQNGQMDCVLKWRFSFLCSFFLSREKTAGAPYRWLDTHAPLMWTKKMMDKQTMTSFLFKTRLDVLHQRLAIPLTTNWDHKLMQESMKRPIFWPDFIQMEWNFWGKNPLHLHTHPETANFSKEKKLHKRKAH